MTDTPKHDTIRDTPYIPPRLFVEGVGVRFLCGTCGDVWQTTITKKQADASRELGGKWFPACATCSCPPPWIKRPPQLRLMHPVEISYRVEGA